MSGSRILNFKVCEGLSLTLLLVFSPSSVAVFWSNPFGLLRTNNRDLQCINHFTFCSYRATFLYELAYVSHVYIEMSEFFTLFTFLF